MPPRGGKHTDWRRQGEGLIRKRKEREKTGSTHELDTTQREGCQDTERNRYRKRHSLSGDGKGGLVRHEMTETERGALTSWGRKKDELVRAQKDSDEEGGAHCLETAEGMTYQDKETKRLSKGHLLSEEGRGMNLSGHEKKGIE